MANIEIRNKFFDQLNERINSQVAKEYKNDILQLSPYRFAVDSEERISFLYHLKADDMPIHHNPLTIKGVKYENGKCELIESEIEELIEEYNINLSNYDFGEFQNERDKEKPFGLKSFRRMENAVFDCLRTQIINEMIKDLKDPNRILDTSKKNFKPFRTIERFNQFKTYIEKHINLKPTSEQDIRNSYTELSFLFQMLKKNSFIEYTKHLDFTDWMFANDFMNVELYRKIFDLGTFKALGKSSPKSKIPIFNIVFELD